MSRVEPKLTVQDCRLPWHLAVRPCPRLVFRGGRYCTWFDREVECRQCPSAMGRWNDFGIRGEHRGHTYEHRGHTYAIDYSEHRGHTYAIDYSVGRCTVCLGCCQTRSRLEKHHGQTSTGGEHRGHTYAIDYSVGRCTVCLGCCQTRSRLEKHHGQTSTGGVPRRLLPCDEPGQSTPDCIPQ